ncbi:hypothetical protein IEQ34_019953 [Dendrobium chrysotoxum]|uniref:Uncharacterized protein n=1 Tax=Dendrobium chrysotoxum TaxID=161865 RepID=A0AAV7FSV4_DENCH|nr:hypothetical protein IEQ34_019953 [Dendrobium chrysotoxum]
MPVKDIISSMHFNQSSWRSCSFGRRLGPLGGWSKEGSNPETFTRVLKRKGSSEIQSRIVFRLFLFYWPKKQDTMEKKDSCSRPHVVGQRLDVVVIIVVESIITSHELFTNPKKPPTSFSGHMKSINAPPGSGNETANGTILMLGLFLYLAGWLFGFPCWQFDFLDGCSVSLLAAWFSLWLFSFPTVCTVSKLLAT